jgi:hypothetical protein
MRTLGIIKQQHSVIIEERRVDLNQIIEQVEIGKYVFQIKNRLSAYRPELKYQVIYSKKTPKARIFKTRTIQTYAFESIEKCEEYIEKAYRNIYVNMQSDLERIKQKKAANAEVKASDYYEIGDIVYNSWGYEQTNIDYYQVVKITPKGIEVAEIKSEIVEGSIYSHGMAYDLTALKDQFIEDGETYKLRVYAAGRLSKPESYYHFSKWDGKPKYRSTYY